MREVRKFGRARTSHIAVDRSRSPQAALGDSASARQSSLPGVGTSVNAVGARVTVQDRKGKQMREVQGGMGYASQSEFPVHFGIPEPNSVERITIQWPSSRVQEIVGEKARALVNHHVRLVEGDQPVVLQPRLLQKPSESASR